MVELDQTALPGKLAQPETHVDVLVIGGGAAGLAAATELATRGLGVLLVDENPLDPQLLGLDVPLFFGGRAGSAVQNSARMMEQIVESQPAIEAAFEAGVDVALGVSCWGVFLPGEASQSLPGPIAALADASRTWTVGFDRLVIASGARDFVVFFDGADQPGVMGALALRSLIEKYNAFEGRRIVVYGAGPLGIQTAELALSRGIEVAAIIDVADTPRSADDRLAALARKGVAIRLGAVLQSARRGGYGVTSATLRNAAGEEETFDCDTICLALGSVPSIELFDGAGLKIKLDGSWGGFVPDSPDRVSTSSPIVFGAGDCMGVSDVPATREEVTQEGLRAAMAVLRSLGHTVDPGSPPRIETGDQLAYRRMIVETMLDAGGCDVLACQCEEVTRGELLDLRAPRYLGPPTPRSLSKTLKTHAADGQLSHDQLKRLTRVSMGACQARRCREQTSLLMAIGAGLPSEAIPLAGYRPPARPLPLSVLATMPETNAMSALWPVWFGIPTQWIPYDAIGTEEEDAMLATHMHL